ncbi:hypothetical protein [Luteibacter sp. SG786]|uniref:hypothetical protein n=1 Tax=Luteibacter sp. SG786 TaxID=2587130 RepID=UPI00141FB99D|nr:hypothetical protein [Luteibacter sp. SG786]NII54362.1 hypothetical protein [Luteibacter sp. SG786]
MEVVINKCFGGFSLSEDGIKRYAELKGLKLYPEKTEYSFTTYWTVPEDFRDGILGEDDWKSASDAERIRSNELHTKLTICDRDIERDDPLLIRVVRELGDKASGQYAALKIVEIPDGIQWEIDEYDGHETVAEVHRTWG